MEDQPTRRPYDEAQHDPVSPPPDISGLEGEDLVDVIKEWFFGNFEDPAEHTPYESAEGGYQYIWGGPYDVDDIIQTFFGDDLTERQFEEVVDSIQDDGTEWVPNIARRQAPDEDEIADFPQPSVESIHEQLLARITEAEGRIEELSRNLTPSVHGIGHNNPPEGIDEAPVTRQELDELRQALNDLKRTPIDPDTEAKKSAEAATEKVEGFRSKLWSWMKEKANLIVDEAIKTSAKLGVAALYATGAYALWGGLASNLDSIIKLAVQWLSYFPMHF